MDAVALEYGAAREGAALIELAERGVLAVSGPQRQKFLHNLLSNDVLSRQPGQGCLAALMDVKGHQVAWLRALVTADAVLLETNADRLQTVEETLLHYKVGAPVRFALRPTAVLALLGPESRSVLARCGCEVPELAPEDHVTLRVAGRDSLAARASDLPAGGLVVHASPDAVSAVRDALVAAGGRPIGRATLDVLRIEAGRPWYGADVTEENLLHETGVLREYHSFSKGCYLGQEVVARLEARGAHVNKSLVGLRLGAPATPGSSVTAAGEDVGRLTTTGVSPRLGPIALGYLRRGHFEPGTQVEVGGVPATVAALPLEG